MPQVTAKEARPAMPPTMPEGTTASSTLRSIRTGSCRGVGAEDREQIAPGARRIHTRARLTTSRKISRAGIQRQQRMVARRPAPGSLARDLTVGCVVRIPDADASTGARTSEAFVVRGARYRAPRRWARPTLPSGISCAGCRDRSCVWRFRAASSSRSARSIRAWTERGSSPPIACSACATGTPRPRCTSRSSANGEPASRPVCSTMRARR
jgi:hypothetical protein